PADYRNAIIDWLRYLHGVEVQPEWLSFIPGIVKGIGLAINCFLKPDEKVVIMPPVYHPFRIVPEMNGREVVWSPLLEVYRRDATSGKETSYATYGIDFDGLERVCDDKCKLLILSNPHNPAGVVWDREDLERLADFCCRRGMLIISDEIHSEMVLPSAEARGVRHVPFYDVSESARRCSITFGAPSKTFNIAGIVSSYAIVPDSTLRERYFTYLKANELDEPTLFAPIATVAAYREGESWRRQMLEYVEGNIDEVISFMEKEFPGGEIRAWRPDASFLVWLDCRGTGLGQQELVELFTRKAGLALNDGAMFGPGGAGFMRLNVGLPRHRLRKALEKLGDAVRNQV
ncbi:MAG: aminotransferase class I/II-fold pyridoxal phosphate-dependent enzyme, partial [Muribaculaceae bacterium]|nr:aminotransferase class I/II-fold pyridoxal phosphate-dependent enzyme [Muribaculaceae bacterium]